MKTIKPFIFLACASMAMCFTACDKGGGMTEVDPNQTTQKGGDDDKDDPADMGAEEQKQYLMNAGQSVLNVFNTADQKDAIKLVDGMINKMEAYKWEYTGFEDYYKQNFDAMFVIPRYVSGVASGRMSPTSAVVYSFSFSSLAALFEANEQTHEFEYKGKSNDNSITVRMKSGSGTQLEAKCWGEGSINKYSYTYYISDDRFSDQPFDGGEKTTIEAELPSTIRFTLKEGSTTIVNVSQTMDIVENDHYNQSGTYTVVNLTWSQDMRFSYQSAAVNIAMKYGTSPLFSFNASLPSYKLAKQNAGESYQDYGQRVAENFENMINSIGSATASIELMDLVQIKARMSNVGDFYDALMNWFSNSDGTLTSAENLCKIYNSYCKAGIYYNSNALQAQVVLKPYESYHDYYTNETWYGVEPQIYFPLDSTTYSYGQYFSENYFGNLIDNLENVVNQYLRLFNNDIIQSSIDLH